MYKYFNLLDFIVKILALPPKLYGKIQVHLTAVLYHRSITLSLRLIGNAYTPRYIDILRSRYEGMTVQNCAGKKIYEL